MNEAQRIVTKTYCGGEFDRPGILDELDDCGDGLFKFLMIELSDKEDCLTMDDAFNRVSTAHEQLTDVLAALDRGWYA